MNKLNAIVSVLRNGVDPIIRVRHGLRLVPLLSVFKFGGSPAYWSRIPTTFPIAVSLVSLGARSAFNPQKGPGRQSDSRTTVPVQQWAHRCNRLAIDYRITVVIG
jgi:hypothetical protein